MFKCQNISLSGHSAKSDCLIPSESLNESVPSQEDDDQRIERRLAAVLALFAGESAEEVSRTFGICRSDLYKFKRRALDAMREALQDQK